MNAQVYDLAHERTVLATRERGRAQGREAVDLLRDGQRLLLLNFNRVEAATPPFLDAFFAELRSLTLGGDSGVMLAVTGAGGDVHESLKMVLEHRDLMMAEFTGEQISLIGGSEQLRETLQAAADFTGPITTPQLAERLEIKLPALHHRLKELTSSGAMARVRDPGVQRGVRHSYTTPAEPDLLDEVRALTGNHS